MTPASPARGDDARSGRPPAPAGVAAWHALPVADVEARLGTSPRGLDRDEVDARLELHGPNRLEEEPPPKALVVFLRQFTSPLIAILLVAGAITVALGEMLDAILIAAVLLANAVIGFAQESRAESAVRSLMKLVVPQSLVVRGGQEWQVDSPDLVPGDVVLLEPGSRVPADLRLSRVNALAIDESLLTGESLPVTKRTSPVSEGAAVADRDSMAFTGSIVTSGRGRGYVVATGADTELGTIAGLIRAEEAAETPLQSRIDALARFIGVAVLIAAVIAFASGVLRGESVQDMFLTAVAMAVSAVPEGLPVAVTITLAIGVSRMVRRNAIIRRLPAVETLGSTTVIGSDKTGTLTENRMTVQEIWAGGRTFRVPADLSCDDGPLRLTLVAGVLTNEAELVHRDGVVASTGDPTEVALLMAGAEAGLDPGELRDRHEVVAEIPFEAERRFSASIRAFDEGHAVFVKGAPERVIGMCSRVLTDEGPVPIDPEAAHGAARALAAEGLRVLAMAYRGIHGADGPRSGDDIGLPLREEDEPDDLVLLGFQGMMDPPRAGVRDAIGACRGAGVRVVMITGDHAITARAIAARLGIIESTDAPVITGSALARLDRDELRAQVGEVAVFARVSPRDKLRIVEALQERGHVVAVTGDGVNDAPALRAAAIGIAMGEGGTDVAREASDMVLSDDNFVSIVAAVEEGRVTFANIRKVAFFLISTGAAEVAAILAAVWLGWPLLLVPA
ncbi:MAG TPA: HAD-IC family P-type ATPase, partial [Acidimicrobiales bacterium]